MLQAITQWFFDLVVKVFSALWNFLVDMAIALADLILSALVALLGAIPVPDFLSAGLNSLFSQLDPGILWLTSAVGVPQALAFYGAAYLFRIARKVVTLFQW